MEKDFEQVQGPNEVNRELQAAFDVLCLVQKSEVETSNDVTSDGILTSSCKLVKQHGRDCCCLLCWSVPAGNFAVWSSA